MKNRTNFRTLRDEKAMEREIDSDTNFRALGTIPKNLENRQGICESRENIETAKKIKLLRLVRIPRRFLKSFGTVVDTQTSQKVNGYYWSEKITKN